MVAVSVPLCIHLGKYIVVQQAQEEEKKREKKTVQKSRVRYNYGANELLNGWYFSSFPLFSFSFSFSLFLCNFFSLANNE